jgi:hypothetical protein
MGQVPESRPDFELVTQVAGFNRTAQSKPVLYFGEFVVICPGKMKQW